MMTRRQALKTLALAAGATPLLANARLAGALETAAQTPAVTAPPPMVAPPPPGPTGPFTLPPLPYAYDALEPFLDAQTMQLHHDKHHAAYVANLNKAILGKPDLERQTVEQLLRGIDVVPPEIRAIVRNHGGGHANHSLLWLSLKKDAGQAPADALGKAIDRQWGDLATFNQKLTAAAMSVFGSGWAWVTTDKAGAVAIETSQNQDSPLMAGRVPLLGIDVWEHAYYLKYQNRRADYVAAFTSVVDWSIVTTRYAEAMKG